MANVVADCRNDRSCRSKYFAHVGVACDDVHQPCHNSSARRWRDFPTIRDGLANQTHVAARKFICPHNESPLPERIRPVLFVVLSSIADSSFACISDTKIEFSV